MCRNTIAGGINQDLVIEAHVDNLVLLRWPFDNPIRHDAGTCHVCVGLYRHHFHAEGGVINGAGARIHEDVVAPLVS